MLQTQATFIQIQTRCTVAGKQAGARLGGLAGGDAVADVAVHQGGRQGRGRGQAVEHLHAVQAERHAHQRRQVRVAAPAAHQLQQRLSPSAIHSLQTVLLASQLSPDATHALPTEGMPAPPSYLHGVVNALR